MYAKVTTWRARASTFAVTYSALAWSAWPRRRRAGGKVNVVLSGGGGSLPASCDVHTSNRSPCASIVLPSAAHMGEAEVVKPAIHTQLNIQVLPPRGTLCLTDVLVFVHCAIVLFALVILTMMPASFLWPG